MAKKGMASPDRTDTKPKEKRIKAEKPIAGVYPVIDNDLARDNVENDITNADLNEL